MTTDWDTPNKGWEPLERKMGLPKSIPADVPPGMALHYATEEQRAVSNARWTGDDYEQALARMLAARRARKLHIRGPLVGSLWVARLPNSPNLTASGLSIEGAYLAWYSYWGGMV